MQLFPRADINTLASSLSLAVANYKPIPTLPTANETLQLTGSSNSSLRLISGGGLLGAGHLRFSTGSSASKSQPLNETEYGQASVLFVPEVPASVGKSRVAAATIGPGKCSVIPQSYTPVGGWDALPAPEFDAFDATMANIYRYRQQQAVNLGAWFVQEGWMQSNFFSCSGGGNSAEIDILRGFGTSAAGVGNATAYYEAHWDTWITEQDFIKLASIGINTVRLPIGYWSAGPYFAAGSDFDAWQNVYANSWRYVARAIRWAAKYDIGVLVDLHGAYGSQNGQDHSGVAGPVNFFTAANRQRTRDLLVWITGELANVTNIVGIQLLNEPKWNSVLWPWYYNTMDAMRQVSATIPLYFHDAFDLNTGAAFVANRTDFVVQDHHSYYVYTASDQSQSAGGHVTDIKGSIRDQYQKQSDIARRNLIQGEWSCALAPSSLAQATNQSRAQTSFCTNQMAVYGKTSAGWHFWSYKMENCQYNGGWCFQQAIKQFLPSTFDSWGLADKTVKFFNVNTTATSGLYTLTSALMELPLPSLTGGVSRVIQKSRVGVVSPARPNRRLESLQNVWNLGGSLSSRAMEEAEKRGTKTAFAQESGWSDGFRSAQIMAGTGKLSRIGFGQQYQQDSFAVRLNLAQVAKSDASAYNTNFVSGVLAAEKLISQYITNFKG